MQVTPTDYMAGCVECHTSCATCASLSANQCNTCTLSEAVVVPAGLGVCVCRDYYVYEVSSAACVPCTNGSKYCLSGTETYKWTSSGAYHMARVAHILDSNLPYTTTTHGLLCYRNSVGTDNDCNVPGLTNAVGALGAAPYAPTAIQCSAMISSQWGYIAHWFPILFPTFDAGTPVGATSENIFKVKTVLQLWILQFDPYEMQSDAAWIALRAVFSNTIPWVTMLAWTGPTPGYTIDGSTEVAFPTDLAAWLALVNVDKAAFNTFSTVCSVAACGNTHCGNAIPGSACA